MTGNNSWGSRLESVAAEAGTVLCVGIDPLLEAFPRELRPSGGVEDVSGTVTIVEAMLDACAAHGITPAAVKPNIGYFAACDQPGNRAAPVAVRYAGMEALAGVMDLLRERLPPVPIILDAKRADIARSSDNYAREAFEVWHADAVTVSPWMGADSVMPFVTHARAAAPAPRGVYLLARTSNPGGALLQNRVVDGVPLFEHVLRAIPEWGSDVLGAVVGATAPVELSRAAAMAVSGPVGSGPVAAGPAASVPAGLGETTASPVAPFLIPGVGRQGAGAAETLARLVAAGYPVGRARINASSGVLFPWAGGASGAASGTASDAASRVPDDWRDQIAAALVRLHGACAISSSGAP